MLRRLTFFDAFTGSGDLLQVLFVALRRELNGTGGYGLASAGRVGGA